MRRTDFQKDQQFYNIEHKAPSKHRDDLLDLYRFNLLLKLYKKSNREDSLFRDKAVLNIAGGYGREAYLILTQKPKFLFLCDYSLKQISQAKEYLGKFNEKYLLCADGESLPFKDKSFDICYITEALHHFIHPERGIEEFIRVTKDAVIIDEPSGGIIREALNRLFIIFGIKEEYERGYLEALRINKQIFKKLCLKYRIDMVFYPYFIYYFEWYKRKKNMFIKVFYKNLLSILNIFFHFLGNRATVIMTFKNGDSPLRFKNPILNLRKIYKK